MSTPDQAAREAAEKRTIQRFDPYTEYVGGGRYDAVMSQGPNGDWVKFSNHVAAIAEREAECERLKKERNDAYQALQDRSLREHAALEELLTKNDSLAAEAERLRGELASFMERYRKAQEARAEAVNESILMAVKVRNTESENAALREQGEKMKRDQEILRAELREHVFYAEPRRFSRSGYTLRTNGDTCYRDIDYRNCPLYETPEAAVDAAIAEARGERE